MPIQGCNCVGCVLPNKIGMINDFVRTNTGRMGETALYKMAGLIFQRDIREPAQREGVHIPPWRWEDIAMHYTFHTKDPRHERAEDLRSLSTLRMHLSDNMMRIDPETGNQVLDKENAKLLLAVIAQTEKNLDAQVRDSVLANAGGGAGGRSKRSNAT